MSDKNTSTPDPPQSQRVPHNLSGQQAARFVSKIKNLEQQVGEHVVAALQHQDTVAVITTVVAGPSGEQHIVSAAINPQLMAQVNALLYAAEQERVDDEICLGFHCLLKPKPA
jgi:PleD family two-component response regulator